MEQLEEKWLPIKGYEDFYLISNFGNVKSLARTALNNRILPERLLKPIDPGNGYRRVTLCKNNNSKFFLVHRLVAEHFLINSNQFPLVHHLNRDSSNNHVSNLEWVSYKKNNIERYKTENRFLKNPQYKRLYPSLEEIKNKINFPFDEEWKDITEYEGIYKISNKGRILSSSRYDIRGYCKKERFLKGSRGNSGFCIRLFKDIKYKVFVVARLVATHFLPNPNKLPFVNHLDGNKFNNNITNLEWCNASTNIIHAHEMGLKHPVCGELHHAAKLSLLEVKKIRELYQSTEMTQETLGKQFGVHEITIRRILTNTQWKQ